jgi:GT2 family glycosyltransferase
VIASYNAAATLGEQLEALACQCWEHAWEVIVADNGSTDGTPALVQAFAGRLPGLRWIDASARRGAAHARNQGVRAARGALIAFCDADDRVAPGWLAGMGWALLKHELVACRIDHQALNAGWVANSRQNAQEDGVARYNEPPYLLHAGAGTLGVRRELFLALGGFDEEWQALEDTDFCFRAQLAGYELHSAPEAVVAVRYRATLPQMIRQTRRYAEYNVRLYKKYRRYGMPRLSASEGLRAWYVALRYAKNIRSRAILAFWVRLLAWRLGRLQGSLRYRVVAL